MLLLCTLLNCAPPWPHHHTPNETGCSSLGLVGTPSSAGQHWGSRVVLPYQLPTLPLGLKWKVSVSGSVVSLCDPVDCSLPGSSVHGILQARILEWAAMPSSSRSFQFKDQTRVSHTGGRVFTIWVTRKPLGIKSVVKCCRVCPHVCWPIPTEKSLGLVKILFIPYFYNRSHQGDSKESACNARGPGLNPGLGDALEKGMITHSSVLAWRILWTEATVLVVAKSWTWLSD